MHERDRIGRERYGVPLTAHNGRDALQDAYEEALDQSVYLKQAMVERDAMLTKIKELEAIKDAVLKWTAAVHESTLAANDVERAERDMCEQLGYEALEMYRSKELSRRHQEGFRNDLRWHLDAYRDILIEAGVLPKEQPTKGSE